mgnify:CR=1 FL=1
MTISAKLKQTLAALKGSQGLLQIYEKQVENVEIKSVLKEAVETTGDIIFDLENRIKNIELQEPQYKGY